jgi:DNA-3-methyladenine glycosylase
MRRERRSSRNPSLCPAEQAQHRMSADPNLSLPWPQGRALPASFFDRDARLLARELLGKVIRHRQGEHWLSVRIIETEAYYLAEKGSHASLGYTHKRRALFMDGGNIYMYYARGGDSLNFSAQGPGNAVLIKSAYPWQDEHSGPAALAQMQLNNPDVQGSWPESSGLGCVRLR